MDVAAAERVWEGCIPEPNTGCWLWSGAINPGGYGALSLGGRTVLAHRASWAGRHGPVPERMFVCHRCDVRACVNPTHLFLGTALDNSADAVAKGRLHDRTGLPIRKLDEDAVREIRASDLTQAELARRFGVSVGTISNVRSRWSWRHVA